MVEAGSVGVAVKELRADTLGIRPYERSAGDSMTQLGNEGPVKHYTTELNSCLT